MSKSIYNVVGMMSGTSLDGIDLAYVKLEKVAQWKYSFLKCETIEYSDFWKQKLGNLINLSKKDIEEIDEEYTDYLASVISKFISQNKIIDIDFVSSHGHTALHDPGKGFTYQIGNLEKLASKLNIEVICDFRTNDVKLGGEGAPLAPIGDKLLFSEYDYCINLGGFANLSTDESGNRIAYDICPLNIVFNHYVKPLDLNFDSGGKIASNGEINLDLLNELNGLTFYKLQPPKSLGFEWVQEKIFPLIDSFKLNINDILRTFLEHCAIQISESIKINNGKVLLTGGGAYNLFFIDRLKINSNATFIVPSPEIIEYKEALIFALLGVLKKRQEINVLSSVTGAKLDHSSGKIFSV